MKHNFSLVCILIGCILLFISAFVPWEVSPPAVVRWGWRLQCLGLVAFALSFVPWYLP